MGKVGGDEHHRIGKDGGGTQQRYGEVGLECDRLEPDHIRIPIPMQFISFFYAFKSRV